MEPLMFKDVAAVAGGLAVKLNRFPFASVVKPTTVPLFEIPLIVVPAEFGVGPSKLTN
jgi:hypothetical protein